MDSKSDVSYIHSYGKEYICAECPAFIPESNQCVFHGYEPGGFLPFDSCNFWMPGPPGQFGVSPLGYITKEESGYARSNYGFGCKRCVHFSTDNFDCEEVDKNSLGDDPGMIHPMACCNEQSLDPVRGQMTSEALIHLIGSPPTMDLHAF